MAKQPLDFASGMLANAPRPGHNRVSCTCESQNKIKGIHEKNATHRPKTYWRVGCHGLKLAKSATENSICDVTEDRHLGYHPWLDCFLKIGSSEEIDIRKFENTPFVIVVCDNNSGRRSDRRHCRR